MKRRKNESIACITQLLIDDHNSHMGDGTDSGYPIIHIMGGDSVNRYILPMILNNLFLKYSSLVHDL